MDIQTVRWESERGWSTPVPDADERDTLVLVFADPAIPNHPDVPLRDVLDKFAHKAVLGCSTAGQVCGEPIGDDSVVVTIARFDRTWLTTATVDVATAGGPRRAGRQLGAALGSGCLRCVLVVGDGLSVNGTALVAGVTDVLPGVDIFGGLAGGGDQSADAWVLAHGEPRRGWVTAVGFVGDNVEFGFGSAGGWDIFGPEQVVTRSYGNVLYELDSRPALAVYRDYLGDRGDGLPAAAMLFPMSIRDLDERTTVRRILAVDEATQSVHFAGDVPQGSLARLMRASNDRLIDGANQAAAKAATGREQLAIAVSCFGRRRVLGRRTDEELDAVLEALQVGTPLAGFYSYGGLSPTDGVCELHNETMTVTTISESGSAGPPSGRANGQVGAQTNSQTSSQTSLKSGGIAA